MVVASIAGAQSPADCNPSSWRAGDPTIGGSLQFTIGAAPDCLVANLLALDQGPTLYGSIPMPIGSNVLFVPIAIVPASGEPAQITLQIPDAAFLAGLELFQLGVGLSLAAPADLVIGPVGRFRFAAAAPAVGDLVILSEHAIDNGMSTVITAAQLLGTTPEFLTNDSNTVLLGNPWLPWSQFYAGSVVTLPMGGPGNEGMFTITGQLPFQVADLVAGTIPQNQLGAVPGIMPVRNQDLAGLVGRTFVALVHDSAIGLNYAPLNANLQGERYGKFAFTVLEVVLPGTISESGSSSSFYDLKIRVEAPMAVGVPLVVPVQDVPSDSIQIDSAVWQNGLLTITATSGFGPGATMTVSVDGFTFESPMQFNTLTAQYEASFRSIASLVGRRVTISTLQGGSYSQTIQ